MSATTETNYHAGPDAVSAKKSRYRRVSKGRGNFELWSWVFMRASGILLLVLVFGHLFVNLMLGEGIHGIDFAFVAGKWSSPFWQTWDLLMLWLAELHGVQRRPHDHQRLHREGPHPVDPQGSAGRERAARHGARHAGHLHLRPVPRPVLHPLRVHGTMTLERRRNQH